MGLFTLPAKPPSPKSQDTPAPPTDVLLNKINFPAHALFGPNVKEATGASRKQIVSFMVFLHFPSALVIVTIIVPVLPPPQVMLTGFTVAEVGVPPVITQA